MKVEIKRGEVPEGFLAAESADSFTGIHYAGNNANEAFVIVVPAIRAVTEIRRRREVVSERMDTEPAWSFQVILADVAPVKYVFRTRGDALAMRAAILLKVENYFGKRSIE
jgi:hypothetical protein